MASHIQCKKITWSTSLLFLSYNHSVTDSSWGNLGKTSLCLASWFCLHIAKSCYFLHLKKNIYSYAVLSFMYCYHWKNELPWNRNKCLSDNDWLIYALLCTRFYLPQEHSVICQYTSMLLNAQRCLSFQLGGFIFFLTDLPILSY